MTRNAKLFLSLFLVFAMLSVFATVALAEPEDTRTVKLEGDLEGVLAYFNGADEPATEFQAPVEAALTIRIEAAEGYQVDSVKLFNYMELLPDENSVYTVDITKDDVTYVINVKATQVATEDPSEDTSEDTSSETPSEDTSSEEPSEEPSEDTTTEEPSEDTSSEETSSEDTSSEESDEPDPSEDPSEDTSSEESSEDTSSEESSEEPVTEAELRVTIKGAGSVTAGETVISGTGNKVTESVWLEIGVATSIKITPAYGYKLVAMKLDGQTRDLTRPLSKLTITELTTLELTFEPDTQTPTTYQIVVSCATVGGYVSAGGYTITSGGATTISVNAGDSLVISVYTAEGYQVDAFRVGGAAQNLTDGTYVLENVAANATVTVSFKAVVVTIDPYEAEDFDWTADENGLIVLDLTGNSYVGKSVFDKINTLTSEDGAFVVLKTEFVQWFIPCGGVVSGVEKEYINFSVAVGANGSYYEIIKNAVLAADAETVFQYFELTETPTFPEGTLAAFNLSEFATAAGGDGVDLMVKDGTSLKVVGTGTTEAGGWTSRMPFLTSRNMVVRIKVLDTYVIQAESALGGTITPAGANTVSRGGEMSFTITANEGFIISALYVDGKPVAGAAGKTAFLYTESNVSADHKIRVEYLSAEENYEIIDNVAVIVEESSEETSVEAPTRDNTGLIVALVIIFVAIVGAAALFIVKWRQERF